MAVTDAAGILTEAGTVRFAALLSESVTTTPPGGAAFERISVQVVWEFDNRPPAAHCRLVRLGRETRDMVLLFREPFNDAVMVAV